MPNELMVHGVEYNPGYVRDKEGELEVSHRATLGPIMLLLALH
jgi:hypothetical protein